MAEPAEAFVGIVLADRYELSSVLGSGQGGMVFKARHRQLDRFVAVKLLAPENMADKTAFMRFEREAHSIGRLNHPNIVTVFDIGRWRNERPYLVMDYIEGQDIQDLIGKEGRLPIARVLKIATQVCSALSHAHKRGVVHRDLKPRNIMVINDDEIDDFVKLVDFGIAKDTGAEQFAETLTLEGYVVGTPQYMSPEQCRGESVDGGTDIYALCGVLFKMITGVNAILGESIGEIMNNQIHQAPQPFETACPHIEVPVEIQRVIYKGLSKDKRQRQDSIFQLSLELTEAYSNASGKSSFAQIVTEKPKHTDSSAGKIDAMRERASAGDVQAQYELVLRLEHGQGCQANPEEARRWLHTAARKGMKEAQWRIGDHLLRGEGGFEWNATEAVGWLTKSSEQGYDQAQFLLGWCYEHGLGTTKDLNQATMWYQHASKQGNSQATDRLRSCVEHLDAADAPLASFEGLLEKETLSNDPETLFALGNKLRDSGKRADDREKAKAIFKRAAMLGHDIAQLAYISICLSDPANQKEQSDAVQWLERSAQQNNENAKLILAACLRHGLGCAKDIQRVQTILDDLISKNNSTAQALLGSSLLVGDGVPRNIPRGITLLKKAAEAGDSYAQWKLAICHRNGIGVMKDQKATETLFQKSAEYAFPQDIDELWRPSGLQFAEAVQIFKSLCAAGNRLAFFWMGICYENGRGVPRDLQQALIHYEQAHAKGLSAVQKAIERIKSGAHA